MGYGGRWPVFVLFIVSSLILFWPVAGSFDYEVPAKPISIMETRIAVVNKRYDVFGATCPLRLIGPMSTYYGSCCFLLVLNETTEFIFEIEVLNAPSEFKTER